MVVSILQALCVLAEIYYAWRIAASYFGRYSRIAGIDRWQVRAGVCRCPRQSVWSTLRQDLIKYTTCCTINNRAVAPHTVYSFFKSYVYPKAICVDRGAVIVKRACVVRSTYITVPGWPPVRRQPSSSSRQTPSPCHCFISLNRYLWLSYIETQGFFSKSTFERAFQVPYYIYMYNYIII